MKTKLLPVITIAICTVLSHTTSYAHNGGMSGVSVVGCGNCHGGQSAAAGVVLEGPRTVRAGQTAAYTFVVTHGNVNNQYAGFNLSMRQNAAPAGTFIAGAGQQILNNELTHNGKKAMAGNAARFDYQWTAPAAHGIYSFNGAGNAVNNDGAETDADDWNVTGNINITVSGANFTAPAPGTSICRGNAITFTWAQTGLGTVRIEWSRNGFTNTDVIGNTVTAANETLTYTIPAAQEPGDYTVRMVDPASGIEIARMGPIAVVGSPTITLQPSSKLVCEGKPLELQVSANGTGLQYRWRQNGTDIPGGTNPILTINQATEAQAGVYDCVIFGCGGSSTSQAATVTIGRKPVITVQPLTRSVCEGANVTFTVDATGNDLVFVWLRNGEPIAGEQGKSLTLTKVTQFEEADYSCFIRGSCAPEVTTNAARLSVVEPPAIRTQPVGKSLKTGDTLVLTFEAKGEELAFQWLKNGVAIPGANQRTFRINRVTRADSGTYACRFGNICDSVSTQSVIVTVTSSDGPGQLELTSEELIVSSLASCGVLDTTIVGLLINEGGSPVTITSISAQPPSIVSVLDIVAPLLLAPNERRNVRFVVTPKVAGSFNASVSFFAQSGVRIFKITGQSQTGLQFVKDTVVFAAGVTADRRCNTSIPLPCAATTVRRIRLTGTGASAWRNVSNLTLPLDVTAQGTIDVCFETLTETSENAVAVIETDAGDASFVLTRGEVVASVDEEVTTSSSVVRVVPNPMVDELRILCATPGVFTVRIVTITGETVALLKGTNEVLWNRQSMQGTLVPAGLYVVVVESGGTRAVEKVLVR